MRVVALQSGSQGNCIYLEAGNTRLLFDAGISGLCAQNRLAYHGIDIHDVDALFITHDHGDHVSTAGVFHRKFKLPIWMTEKTYHAAARRMGKLRSVEHFRSGTTFRFQDVTIEAIPTPHDAADGVCFVVDDGRRRFGICTDLGHVFDELKDVVASLDGVLLESNYDPEMLDNGMYPEDLKDRVRGKRGHLSNFDAAELLDQYGSRLQTVLLGHISDENNREPLVRETLHQVVGNRFPCELAHRHTSSNLLEIS
ncbi:MAG: MBL fold metallo-hydrolase [Planctomycetia bacterium]|nr:MBL fold metallo-hydrolase [Planctomycetia bacterium]